MGRIVRKHARTISNNRTVQSAVVTASKLLATQIGNYIGAPRGSDEINGRTRGFLNFGDRGTQNTVYRKRKRRKITRRGRMRRKRVIRFKKKVRKVLREKQGLRTYLEKTDVGYPIDSNDAGVGGGLSFNTGEQVVWGSSYGLLLNPGGAWGITGCTGWYLAAENNDYNPIIQGTITTIPTGALNTRVSSAFITRNHLTITIVNANSDFQRDLVFDLYECTANMNITESAFATPANAFFQCGQDVTTYTTATGYNNYTLGAKPTDFARFGKYWTINKVQKCRIPYAEAGGGGATLTQNYQMYTMYGRKHAFNTVKHNDFYAIKGITRAFMIVFDPDVYRPRYDINEHMAVLYMERKTKWVNYNNGFQASNTLNLPNILLRAVPNTALA